MIDANSKTNSFLQAIEKYAEEQKNAMKAEVEAFREEQLARANEEGTAAAFAFIQTEKARFAASLAKEKSQKEADIKRELFGKRNKMVSSLFVQAEKKLLEFVKSKKYKGDKITENQSVLIKIHISNKLIPWLATKMATIPIINEALRAIFNFVFSDNSFF